MPSLTPPEITESLVTFLSSVIPDRCPDLTMSDRDVWFAAGRASVVAYLRSLKQQQDEESSS